MVSARQNSGFLKGQDYGYSYSPDSSKTGPSKNRTIQILIFKKPSFQIILGYKRSVFEFPPWFGIQIVESCPLVE